MNFTSACRRRRRTKAQSTERITRPSGSIQIPSTGKKLNAPPNTKTRPSKVRPSRVCGKLALRALIQSDKAAASSDAGKIPGPPSVERPQFQNPDIDPSNDSPALTMGTSMRRELGRLTARTPDDATWERRTECTSPSCGSSPRPLTKKNGHPRDHGARLPKKTNLQHRQSPINIGNDIICRKLSTWPN